MPPRSPSLSFPPRWQLSSLRATLNPLASQRPLQMPRCQPAAQPPSDEPGPCQAALAAGLSSPAQPAACRYLECPLCQVTPSEAFWQKARAGCHPPLCKGLTLRELPNGFQLQRSGSGCPLQTLAAGRAAPRRFSLPHRLCWAQYKSYYPGSTGRKLRHRGTKRRVGQRQPGRRAQAPSEDSACAGFPAIRPSLWPAASLWCRQVSRIISDRDRQLEATRARAARAPD